MSEEKPKPPVEFGVTGEAVPCEKLVAVSEVVDGLPTAGRPFEVEILSEDVVSSLTTLANFPPGSKLSVVDFADPATETGGTEAGDGTEGGV